MVHRRVRNKQRPHHVTIQLGEPLTGAFISFFWPTFAKSFTAFGIAGQQILDSRKCRLGFRMERYKSKENEESFYRTSVCDSRFFVLKKAKRRSSDSREESLSAETASLVFLSTKTSCGGRGHGVFRATRPGSAGRRRCRRPAWRRGSRRGRAPASPSPSAATSAATAGRRRGRRSGPEDRRGGRR